MRKVTASAPLTIALAACLAGGAAWSAAVHAAPSSPPTAPPSAVPARPAPGAPLVTPNRFGLPDFGDLVDQVAPAVVNISVVRQQGGAEGGLSPDDPFYEFLRRFGIPAPGLGQPGRGPRISRGIGSGFIVSADGYVLTNAHVVGEGQAEVTVRLSDRREFKAKVVGSDRRTDIAVLKIEAKGLPVVRTGNPEQSRVGEWVVAVGSPFGFDSTVTAGIISAKARRLPDENYVPFIQTDVAINPGNSGGPLFNLAGEVIGINSQIYSRSGGFMGISFAIPIDVALAVRDQIVQFGRVQRGKLGVTIQGLDKELAQSFGLSEPAGALIASVEPGSAAEKAGLRAGDVVLAVDGVKAADSADLPRLIGEKRPGSTVRLEVWRDGKRQTVSATLDEMNPETVAEGPGAQGGQDAGGKLGLRGRALTAEEANQLGTRGGVLVEQVSGPAAQAGLQPGDVILAVNNQPVTGVDALRKLLERAGNRFALLVQRGSSRLFVPVRVN